MRWIQILGLKEPLYSGRRTATVRYFELARYLPTLTLLLVVSPTPAQQTAPVARRTVLIAMGQNHGLVACTC